MRQAVSRRRFRSVITREGTIIVPDAAREGLKAGQSVWVEIGPTAGKAAHRSPHAIDDPDDQEVAAIAALQLEHPDVIRRCLRAQGTLARRKGTGGRSRAAKAPIRQIR
jgi:hypothetical protein